MVYLGVDFCSVLALPNVSSCLGLPETIRKNRIVIIDRRYNSFQILMLLLNQNTKKLMEVARERALATGELGGPALCTG